MAENSKIEWCDHTFNAWEGCEKVSPGCAGCYAERRDKQYHGGEHWGPDGTRKMMSESYWKWPLRWNVCRFQCSLCGTMNHPNSTICAKEKCFGESKDFVLVKRPRVFCSSLADVFEDRLELEASRRRLFKLIQATPNLDWLLLTKRPENIHRLTYKAIDPFDDPDCDYNAAGEPNGLDVAEFGELYPNIWLGTTVENQEQANKRIPELLKIPAKVRFLSCEPLLGPVELGFALASRIHWVIAGGESGPGARPMQIEWARSLRDQCQAAGVPFFFKQHGEWISGKFDRRKSKMVCDATEPGKEFGRIFWTNPGEPKVHLWGEVDHYWTNASARVGKKDAGRILDGQEWNQFPV